MAYYRQKKFAEFAKTMSALVDSPEASYSVEEWNRRVEGVRTYLAKAWKWSKEGTPSVANCVEGQCLRYIARGKMTDSEMDAALADIRSTPVPPKLEEESYAEYIPESSDCFVETGRNWRFIDQIVKEERFFPMYVYGISGLGKTMQIEQACAKHKRPFFRAQITKDTTSEELVGSYSLINGNTVWVDGPILKAYRSGGILLLDEIDLNPSLMVLQGVLENKSIYVFQTGELVRPKKGFQVFATGNTKGDGSSFEYVGTTSLNKAFLERFDWILEQKIPSIASERKIIGRWLHVNRIEVPEADLECLYKFIDIVWKSFQSGDSAIFLSSRRIQSIIKGWTLCGRFEDAIAMALAHYPEEEAKALVNVWKAVAPADADVQKAEA